MADTKVSALTAASTLAGTELVKVVQSSTDKKATIDDFSTRSETRAQHSCRCFHSSTQSHTTATWTTLSFDSETFDYGTMHDTSTNNSRVTPTVGGIYLVIGQVLFADATDTTERRARILVNGASGFVGDRMAALSGTTTAVRAMHLVSLNGSTDYVELQGYQASGGNLNAQSGQDTHLSAALIHRT